MTAQFGTCGLCLRHRELCDSHLLPAALYKMLRDPASEADPNPVVVGEGKALTSSQHVSSHFLCYDCEERLSEKGERHVLAQCARSDGEFKLRDLLQAASPLLTTCQFKTYNVQPLLGTKVEQYLYFAASVFWRTAAHDWKKGTRPLRGISLGHKYQEQFRLYLLGDEVFPENARIFVHVSSESQPDATIVFPTTIRQDRVRRHKFYIPGLLFILFLGKDVSERFAGGALNGSEGQVMWLCPWRDDSLFLASHKLVKAATPVGKLRGEG